MMKSTYKETPTCDCCNEPACYRLTPEKGDPETNKWLNLCGTHYHELEDHFTKKTKEVKT